jgi:hypothetical protein
MKSGTLAERRAQMDYVRSFRGCGKGKKKCPRRKGKGKAKRGGKKSLKGSSYAAQLRRIRHARSFLGK